MTKDFASILDKINKISKSGYRSEESSIVHGTVTNLSPLTIVSTHDGMEIDSESIYLTDNVIVKKCSLVVHSVHGEPESIDIEGNAANVSSALTAMMFKTVHDCDNITLSARAVDDTGGNPFNFTVIPPRGYLDSGGISIQVTGATGAIADINGLIKDLDGTFTINGLSTIKTINTLKLFMELNKAIAFNILFDEKPENQPKLNEPRQPQTVVIKGILWQGLKVGDIVLITSHNHKQKYLVHRILNRHRESDFDRLMQYEQSYLWDSRVSDIPSINNFEPQNR